MAAGGLLPFDEQLAVLRVLTTAARDWACDVFTATSCHSCHRNGCAVCSWRGMFPWCVRCGWTPVGHERG